MSLTTLNVLSFDPNIVTGPTRYITGMTRTLTPTVDVAYGEFMTRLYIGTAGNVSYVKWDGTTQVLTNLAVGIVHNICSIMINSGGTTATGIVVGS